MSLYVSLICIFKTPAYGSKKDLFVFKCSSVGISHTSSPLQILLFLLHNEDFGLSRKVNVSRFSAFTNSLGEQRYWNWYIVLKRIKVIYTSCWVAYPLLAITASIWWPNNTKLVHVMLFLACLLVVLCFGGWFLLCSSGGLRSGD